MIVPVKIMARDHSERVPDKNGRMFCGKPLIEWTFLCGQKARYIGDMYLITDSMRYAEIADRHGVHVIWQPETMCNFGRWGGPAVDMFFYSYMIRNNLLFPWIAALGVNAPLKRPIDIDSMIAYVDKFHKHKKHLVEVSGACDMGSTGLYMDGGNYKVIDLGALTTAYDSHRLLMHGGGLGIRNWEASVRTYDYADLIFEDLEKGIIKPEIIAGDDTWTKHLEEYGIVSFHPEMVAKKEMYYYHIPRYAGIDIDDLYDWNYCEWAFEKYILNEGYYD